MKIFITGATGMVGRNLLAHPGICGEELVAPTRAELDLLDAHAVEHALSLEKPDLVIHAAGRVGGVQANLAQPVDYLIDNSLIGIHVIHSALNAGVSRLINIASSCMYPRGLGRPFRECDLLTGELEPTNESYALAKLTTTRLCAYVRDQYPDFEYKSLIACTLYGIWDHFEAERSHLVAAAIRKVHEAIVQERPSVDIWGDGSARREFMYAGDLVDCITRALVNFEDLPGEMNVGHGKDHTVNDYYRVIGETLGFSGRFNYQHDKPVGMAEKVLNIERQLNWGWAPSTELRVGVQQAYEYFCTTTEAE